MKMDDGVLTIFPTELAKRRHERQAVLKTGVLATSRLLTQKTLLTLCERAARRTGRLNGHSPCPVELRLLVEEAAGSVHFAPGQPLAGLSSAGRASLLHTLIEKLACFAENEEALLQWLLAQEAHHKLHGFGQLLQAWHSLCTKMDIADRFAVNRALLQLAEGGELPRELDGEIHFRAVRWFNPFEEAFAIALKKRLGRVKVFSVLPGAHAQVAEDRLRTVVHSELMPGAEEEWAPWLEDLADAIEADDSNLLDPESRRRVSFFVSAHPYGEIEDAARRIADKIEGGTRPDEIALILRDLSPYTDIIPDVFRRFGIPYYFRRGTPAAAHPPVKALLALLAFPQTRSRDRLCDLLQLPGIDWPGLDLEARKVLVQEIRKKEPPRLFRLPKELQTLKGPSTPKQFAEHAQEVVEQHGLDLPEEVLNLLEQIGSITARPMPPDRLMTLFEELLNNVTIQDELSTESGVWIINPMDAAGLRFTSVYIAGMDDRTFPQIPQADSLFNDKERKNLRAFLEERNIPCPRLALTEVGEALIQEEILFLTAMSTARETLTLSYTRIDTDGKERAPGEFFERMRGLTQCEQPTNGQSFYSILPPEACRAEDETRQTEAWLNPSPPTIQQSVIPIPALQKWLKDHPELSATALESLARNRYVFFLEKVLGIKPDRTHEDDTDPMDRGTIVHDILEQVYKAIAEQSDLYADHSSGVWRISQSGEIPLAVFDPAKADELLALARDIANEEFAKAERRPSRHLGHCAVWETEKRKLHQVIENFIRMDLETALKENRYPALFEMKFDEKHDLPLTLHNVGQASNLSSPEKPSDGNQAGSLSYIDSIRLKGKIDRIDLIFNDDGALEKILVVDYKGKSRNDSIEMLEKKIGLNLDCQLALYTFAAQQKFFGEHNVPELNEKVQAVYHLQDRVLKKMTNHFSKRRLTMNPELTDAFLETLFSNVLKLSNGDLATEPLIAGYEDYSHICRTTAIDPKDLLKEG